MKIQFTSDAYPNENTWHTDRANNSAGDFYSDQGRYRKQRCFSFKATYDGTRGKGQPENESSSSSFVLG